MKLSEIHLRDPFVLPVRDDASYYLFGSTDENVWAGPGTGFDCFRSRDLVDWEGPFPAFRPGEGFWGKTQFWAPEVFAFNGRYFMLATFNPYDGYRGTQILSSTQPLGPYHPWSDGAVTPPHWQCLDGTLHPDGTGAPWIVFCQEWVQVHNGAMWACRLSADLRRAVGQPVFLFSATDAPWVRCLQMSDPQGTAGAEPRRYQFPVYVTDGPFLHRTKAGTLIMLWSSFGSGGYAMGIACSDSGNVRGPWTQERAPLWAKDGGHGMLFRTFDSRLFLTLHTPNDAPNERPLFCEVFEEENSLRMKS